jgi:sensor histidine kinase regulating citrate/malate metabolism
MPQTKRRLQIVTSLAVATFILVAGTIGAMTAAGRLRQMLERQMAEDSQVIGENLKIIISQATRELAQGERAFDKVQVVLESLQVGGWRGFACIVDKDGVIVAHPNPSVRGSHVRLEDYAATSLAKTPDRVELLTEGSESSSGV